MSVIIATCKPTYSLLLVFYEQTNNHFLSSGIIRKKVPSKIITFRNQKQIARLQITTLRRRSRDPMQERIPLISSISPYGLALTIRKILELFQTSFVTTLPPPFSVFQYANELYLKEEIKKR